MVAGFVSNATRLLSFQWQKPRINEDLNRTPDIGCRPRFRVGMGLRVELGLTLKTAGKSFCLRKSKMSGAIPIRACNSRRANDRLTTGRKLARPAMWHGRPGGAISAIERTRSDSTITPRRGCDTSHYRSSVHPAPGGLSDRFPRYAPSLCLELNRHPGEKPRRCGPRSPPSRPDT